MEEVWKDLSLSSLRHHSTTAAAASSSDEPPVCGPTLQEFLECPLYKNTAFDNQTDQTISCFNALTSATDSCDFSKRKIGSAGADENVSDRKRQRLMKNRESASRSRARKQAYTHELELEVAHLMEENAKLRKEQQKMYIAALGYNEHKKRHKLCRTLTAPF